MHMERASARVQTCAINSFCKLKTEANIMQLRSNYTPIIREIINFQFSNYPQHVKNLDNFSWKPLIIAQEMKKHPGDNLVWMDTSTMINKRLPNPKYLTAKFENFTKDHGSWILIDYTGHSILAATNPKMYNFLPLPKKLAYRCPMFGANIQILFAGSDSSSNRFVAKWWVRCALEQTCIAPYNSHLLCEFQKQGGQLDKFNYANCHRYDQSALNILLSWVNGFDSSRHSDTHQIFKDSFAILCEALYFNQVDVMATKRGAGETGDSTIRGDRVNNNRRLLRDVDTTTINGATFFDLYQSGYLIAKNLSKPKMKLNNEDPSMIEEVLKVINILEQCINWKGKRKIGETIEI
uniref:DDE-1 domain-containing protein n=1 Tax=Romanomermis culicivorax TaxID=13658 RepID=A0A915IZH2_ROMCU